MTTTAPDAPLEEAWHGGFPWRREGGYHVSPEWWDFRDPDYARLFDERAARLELLRSDPQLLADVNEYYRGEPADFINDWGTTYDPRNADVDELTLVPFVLWPKQREWIDWVMWLWRTRQNGLCEKSRDMGVTWLAMALASTLCLFRDGVQVITTSYLGRLVDGVGTLTPLLPRARMFTRNLPVDFRPGWEEWRDAPQMRVSYPATGSLIAGDVGKEIGRGGRASIVFVDEAARVAPSLEAALRDTAHCRIDLSTPRGYNNMFAQKRFSGKVPVFLFDWREDPRKDDAWYAAQVEKTVDPVVLAQEVDRDYSASVEGIVIPGAWVRAAIGAREKLRLGVNGERGMALDVADEGLDMNAVAKTHGIEIQRTLEWSGKGADLFATAERCFALCDEEGYKGFRYDADGLGAGIRGDARVINDRRKAQNVRQLSVIGFRGSEAVVDPDGIVEGTKGSPGDKGRTNKDYFANRKAQAWWSLRRRFERTYQWVVNDRECDPDEIISISKACPNHLKLVAELSQPTFSTNGVGKIVIDKKPNGMKSPNLADAVVIRYARLEREPMRITEEMLNTFRAAGPRRVY